MKASLGFVKQAYQSRGRAIQPHCVPEQLWLWVGSRLVEKLFKLFLDIIKVIAVKDS